MNQLIEKYNPEIQSILAKYPANYKRSAIMPLLYLAQRENGRLTQESMAEIAEISEVTITEVASLAGFYTLFHEEPGGKYRIQICTDLPCALRGADQFFQKVSEALNVEDGETTADGLFTLEAVKCLAACHRAPLFQLQGDGEIKYYENQSLETFQEIIATIRSSQKKVGGEEKA